MGRELTDKTIPQEAGSLVEHTVSFTKGCYTGQELVARLDARGANVGTGGSAVSCWARPPRARRMRRLSSHGTRWAISRASPGRRASEHPSLSLMCAATSCSLPRPP